MADPYGQRESLIGPSLIFRGHAQEARRRAIQAERDGALHLGSEYRDDADIWDRAAAMSEAWERLAAAVYERAEDVLDGGFDTDEANRAALRQAMAELTGGSGSTAIARHMEASRR